MALALTPLQSKGPLNQHVAAWPLFTETGLFLVFQALPTTRGRGPCVRPVVL